MANTVITFNRNVPGEIKKETSGKETYIDISRQSVQSLKYKKILEEFNKKLVEDTTDLKVSKSVNLQAVSNSLHNIFEFFPGERVLYPEFGSKLKMHLYNGITIFNQEQIVAEIYSNLERFDSRVVIDDIIIETSDDDKDDNTVQLKILYHIDGMPSSHYSYEYSYITNS